VQVINGPDNLLEIALSYATDVHTDTGVHFRLSVELWELKVRWYPGRAPGGSSVLACLCTAWNILLESLLVYGH